MKLVILDRDGVINYDSQYYIKSPDEWHEIPGSLDAIVRLNQAGYKVAVASNQSGIARGLYTEETLHQIHAKMLKQLSNYGGVIDKIVYCPHLPSEGCECRKPKTGLLRQIAAHFQCSLTGIPFVGDRLSDVMAAVAVGAIPIVLGQAVKQELQDFQVHENKIYYFDNLSAAVDMILQENF